MGTDVSAMTRKYRTATTAEFPDELKLELARDPNLSLRYGENPMQPAAVYSFKGTSLAEYTNIRLAKTGKGGVSAINLMDVLRAMDILKFFSIPACAVMKHNIPSGFATEFNGNSLHEVYKNARDADRRSAFGSVVVFNNPVDVVTASEIITTYVEGVAAPEYATGAIGILEQKKDLRVMQFSNLNKLPKFVGDDTEGLYDLKVCPTGRVIVQKPYLTSIRGVEDLVLDPMVNEISVQRLPSNQELTDMITAWYVNFGVRSNGIVFVKDGVTLAIGSGQQERIGAIEQAIVKAYQKFFDRNKIPYDPIYGIVTQGMRYQLKESPLKGAVCSSDAFFPFRDSIDTIAKVGVTSVIQPGGSVRDSEVIQAVNEHKMSMAFTLERCFGHF